MIVAKKEVGASYRRRAAGMFAAWGGRIVGGGDGDGVTVASGGGAQKSDPRKVLVVSLKWR